LAFVVASESEDRIFSSSLSTEVFCGCTGVNFCNCASAEQSSKRRNLGNLYFYGSEDVLWFLGDVDNLAARFEMTKLVSAELSDTEKQLNRTIKYIFRVPTGQ
jgi:hypothetical protein